MRLTRAELARLVDKSSRDPDVVRLYEEHDFLDAYALHTDQRVANDPHAAIGGLWEEYGELCRDYLIAQGLLPEHRLLDFGCGTGRLARKVVPYLEPGRYFGVDISRKALAHAWKLARDEGWSNQLPSFLHSDFMDDLRPFDFVWAFSVMIHLPPSEVERAFARIARLLRPSGRFLFSYVPTPTHVRTGLKQFKHPFAFYEEALADCGLIVTEVAWPGLQRIALARFAARA